mmetsp:Transcript_81907/g.228266  ORF Transcript_81907/g.228266 Transcript_81907/m.228266 type:complete len:228 (+) Transcript_81907:1135-1818(+)
MGERANGAAAALRHVGERGAEALLVARGGERNPCRAKGPLPLVGDTCSNSTWHHPAAEAHNSEPFCLHFSRQHPIRVTVERKTPFALAVREATNVATATPAVASPRLVLCRVVRDFVPGMRERARVAIRAGRALQTAARNVPILDLTRDGVHGRPPTLRLEVVTKALGSFALRTMETAISGLAVEFGTWFCVEPHQRLMVLRLLPRVVPIGQLQLCLRGAHLRWSPT